MDVWQIGRGLEYAYGCHSSRVDLAIDDYTRQHIPLKEMIESTQRGDNFYFSKYEHLVSEKDGREGHGFGSRKSEKYVRIYDRGDCIRSETEFGGRLSTKVFSLVNSIERDWFLNLSKQGSKTKFNDSFSIKPGARNISNWLENINVRTQVITKNELIVLARSCHGSFELFLEKIIGLIAVSTIDFRDRSIRKDRSKASYRETTRLSFYQNFIDKVAAIIRIKSGNYQHDWINNDDDLDSIFFVWYKLLEVFIKGKSNYSNPLKLLECLI